MFARELVSRLEQNGTPPQLLVLGFDLFLGTPCDGVVGVLDVDAAHGVGVDGDVGRNDFVK